MADGTYEENWPGASQPDPEDEGDDWVPPTGAPLLSEPAAVSDDSVPPTEAFLASADSATLDRVVVSMLSGLEETPVEARGLIVQSAQAFAVLSVGRALRERTAKEDAPPVAWKLNRETGDFEQVLGE